MLLMRKTRQVKILPFPLLRVASSHNQTHADCREEEGERDWRAWSWDACSPLLIDLVPIFALKLIWHTALSSIIDVEALRTNQTNQYALVHRLVVPANYCFIPILVWTVVDACALVEQEVFCACSTCVRLAMAS